MCWVFRTEAIRAFDKKVSKLGRLFSTRSQEKGFTGVAWLPLTKIWIGAYTPEQTADIAYDLEFDKHDIVTKFKHQYMLKCTIFYLLGILCLLLSL